MFGKIHTVELGQFIIWKTFQYYTIVDLNFFPVQVGLLFEKVNGLSGSVTMRQSHCEECTTLIFKREKNSREYLKKNFEEQARSCNYDSLRKIHYTPFSLIANVQKLLPFSSIHNARQFTFSKYIYLFRNTFIRD